MKPVWGLINAHNRQQFQITLLSDCPLSQIQNGYQPHSSDRYFDTSSLPNDALRDLINSELDILIDLNGYSNMRRLPLFLTPLKPVTIGWFNLYATTGMSGFDYLIGDEHVIRPEEECFYSERVLRVPGSYLPFEVSYPVPPVAARPGGPRPLVFGSLTSQYKITNQVIGAWSQILAGSPGATLLLKNRHLSSASGREYLQSRFAAFGITPDRLRLEPPEDHFEFLKAYDRMDLALDTFPYNGGTTTSEAIWQGVPVLTFAGDRWASRTSASILRAAGLDSFVAANERDFVQSGIKLADHADELTASRSTMRDSLRKSAICDLAGFARAMEAIYFSVRNCR